MRLFRLEVKRILKSRRTLILLAAALLLSIVMAILPVTFESINRPEKDGTVTELNGLEAIRFKKEYYKKTEGTVTPQKMAQALETYQSFVQKYGSLDDIPLDIYIENILPVRPVLKGLPEIFADSATGVGADLMEIDSAQVEEHLYEKCSSHLDDIMKMEQKKHPAAIAFAADKYTDVEKPFQLYPGLSRDAFDYITLYLLLLSILCIAVAAPVFADEYQTGSDSILRCTKYGRKKLAVTRILAVDCILTVTFLLGMSIHLLLLNLAFGRDCLKTSMQMLFSAISLPDLNLGQLQVILAAAGLVSIWACISFTLFLSARCRDNLSVLILSVVMLLFPAFAYIGFGESTWISSVLPSSGIGMQNNFLYQLCGFHFLHIGNLSLWTPYVILFSAAIEIPLFLLLAVRVYCRHSFRAA